MKTIALVAMLALVGTAKVSGSFSDTFLANTKAVELVQADVYTTYIANHPDFAAELVQLRSEYTAPNPNTQKLAAEVVALAPDLHTLGPNYEKLFDLPEAAAAASPAGRKLLVV